MIPRSRSPRFLHIERQNHINTALLRALESGLKRPLRGVFRLHGHILPRVRPSAASRSGPGRPVSSISEGPVGQLLLMRTVYARCLERRRMQPFPGTFCPDGRPPARKLGHTSHNAVWGTLADLGRHRRVRLGGHVLPTQRRVTLRRRPEPLSGCPSLSEVICSRMAWLTKTHMDYPLALLSQTRALFSHAVGCASMVGAV